MAQSRSLRSVPSVIALAFVLAACSSTRIDPLEFDYYSTERRVDPIEYAAYPVPASVRPRAETAPIVPIGGGVTAAAPMTITIQKGDSLYALSRQHLGSGNRWREIARLNGLSDADVKRLAVGRVLKLPAR